MPDPGTWPNWTPAEQQEALEAWLRELDDIAAGRHELSGTRAQGRLAARRRELEETVLQVLALEDGLPAGQYRLRARESA